MIQIQPHYSAKNEWLELARREALRYEILEFSSVYLNGPVPHDVLAFYKDIKITDSIHGAFIDNYPVSINFDIQGISRKKCEESMKQAVKIGASNVVFHSTALPFVRGGLENIWGKDAAEYYSFLAKKYDKHIYIENFNDVDPTPMRLMMENIQDDRVGICLDVAHANYSITSLEKWFDELGDYIGYLHLSDNAGCWDDHIILGTGNTNLRLVNDWWEKKNKDIPITIEMKTLEETEKSINFLKDNGMFGLSK
ncbi:MAG: TIM barrel protein [Lachnospiraceae bacterium]|nr:TIM barrel protein [Candidatus Colinaster equi]